MPSDCIRLLALDGGGIRGLSSLIILQHLMTTINPKSPPKPCEYFDMIGGTSTGGLIAVMLGRLRMTVGECIDAYIRLSHKAFEKKNHRLTMKGGIRGRFSTSELEQAVKQILTERGIDQEMLLLDSDDASCKVFVCAVSKQTSEVVCLTSYRSPRSSTHLLHSTKIWQACRATSAATSFFDPIAIGPFNEEFVDGALGANNPVYVLWNQAQDVWGDLMGGRLKCLVSIGTGIPLLQPIHDNALGIWTSLKELATETESTAEQFRRDKSELDGGGRYYRFNVDRGLQDIGLEESKKKAEIAAITTRYIVSQVVLQQINACASNLAGRELPGQPMCTPQKLDQCPLSTEDQACLRDLRTTNPRDDKTRIQDIEGGLLKDSYRWVLKNDDFKRWRNHESSHLLWIKGDPGKGKTMLLCGIIDELTSSIPETAALSFFFCQASDVRTNNATDVVRGLIFLLVDKQPSLLRHVRKEYDQVGKDLFEDLNAWQVLSRIFMAILEDPILEDTYLIIDALDECRTGLHPLLSLIVQRLSSHPRVRWVVSSRNWPAIEERLNTAGQKLWLEKNEESVSEAVAVYIQHKVRQLSTLKRYDKDLRDTVYQHLLSNSHGTFLWVALVCQELSNIPRWNTSKKLAEFPPKLDAVYQWMINRISHLDDAQLYRNILGVVSVVCRPITLHELSSFVSLPKITFDDHESFEEIIRFCGSFLIVRRQAVFFVHQSAKQFLLEERPKNVFPIGIEGIHLNLFSRSLEVFSETLGRDLYNLGAPGFNIDKIIQPDPDPLAVARYSCVYWIDHLDLYISSKGLSNDFQVGEVIDRFLSETYLYWLEALGLMRSVAAGVTSMLKLEDLLRKMGNSSSLVTKARDALRFIRYHRFAIEASPLQVYSSGLLFSPARSTTRDSFKEEAPKWVVVNSGTEDDWGPCLLTLEGHTDSVTCLAWSHDTSWLASASLDTTVKIWDPITGKCISTLEGHHDSVTSLAWSHSTGWLASASLDTTVKIWDPITSQCISTLNSQYHPVTSIACLQDIKRIASVLETGTVIIWDIITGQCVSTLQTHGRHVALSSDGTRVVSIQANGTASVWDLINGHCMSIFQAQVSDFAIHAISPDLVWLSTTREYDPQLMIWNLATGKIIHRLEDHFDPIKYIAWSQDTTQVASGSEDRSIKIWDPATGKRTSTLIGHNDSVTSLAWSHCTKWLASASDDKTIKIWDPALTQQNMSIWEYEDQITSLVWSPDRTQLASSSYGTTVKIWDPTTGQLICDLGDYDDWVSWMAWSHDSTRLACASLDAKIGVWDLANLANNTLPFFLQGHQYSVHTVVWSRDSAKLASGSEDNTVKIWDSITGDCLSTLEGHSDTVIWLCWSFPSGRIASQSSDGIYKYWDPNEGTCIATFDFHSIPDVLRSYKSDWLRLPTLQALFCSTNDSPVPGLTNLVPGYHLKDNWIITREGENLLWLPPGYRPVSQRALDISGSFVAIGCPSGRILVLVFSEHLV